MKIYLSYPMSNATVDDKAVRFLMRHFLQNETALEVYDPEICEPMGMTMPEMQDYDLTRMAQCQGLLIVWSETTHRSAGVLAEAEWARRIFGIPIVVYKEAARELQPWFAATVRDEVYPSLSAAAYRLEELMGIALDGPAVAK